MGGPAVPDSGTGAPTAPRGHVLLVSPRTFTYHEVICDTLRRMGYRVTWWDERASRHTAYKLALRLLPGITARWTAGHYLRALHALAGEQVTHMLVIKGEGLSRQVVLAMRQQFADAAMGYYLWDGLDNVRGARGIADVFDAVASFDPVDAAAQGWRHRPLFSSFARPGQAAPAPVAKSFDWCFIGTLHSDRHRVIHRLRQRGGPAVRSFVFGFSPSRWMLAVRRLTDWTLWSAPPGSLSTVPLPASQVQDIVARSAAVLDVEHPRQRGLTMRTIETLMAGHKLVTTNAHITDSDLFHPSRAQVISRQAPAIPPAFLQQPFEPLPAALRQRYTCEGWLAELLAWAEAGRASRPGAARQPQPGLA